ncbi:OmpA family protein [Lacinutrix sp. C3R15]|uniref:OmpA family protein n=1 Tax=Flavobacteriaceae TaxID=49546 RepID=UPI001C081071|nr:MULTISPECIES: OmpA family protein [Flavobacteriaceae]MBU2937922.1 OmpA family protein [Lacinutrix sp. C3R15]MDO6621236.1 OmpA family protein [Oceanihabitans sp. 1_MG-2023]
MSKRTSYLFGILLTIGVGTFLNWRFCCNNASCEQNKVDENIEVLKEKEVTLNPLTIEDGDYTIKSSSNFNFKASTFKIEEPISEELKNAVLGLKTYLDENLLKRVAITGCYIGQETNNSAYPNLGLARANAVKNYFVSQGISSKNIDTSSELKDTLVADENTVLFGPISCKLVTVSKETTTVNEALLAACEDLKTNPLVLYFSPGKAQIKLTEEQRQKIANISRCVDKLGVKALVVGFTDNTGNAANNMVLGQQRSDFVKKYLIQNGILSTNIEATSKGSSEPIADNATKEGRAKNRRTIVTINSVKINKN